MKSLVLTHIDLTAPGPLVLTQSGSNTSVLTEISNRSREEQPWRLNSSNWCSSIRIELHECPTGLLLPNLILFLVYEI